MFEAHSRPVKSRSPPVQRDAKLPRKEDLAMDVVEPSLSMPAPGAGAGTIYPSQSSVPPQPAGPSSGNDGGNIDVHALVAASMQSQIDEFSVAVQKNITGDS